jgi:lysophospholipase L1-like esterase
LSRYTTRLPPEDFERVLRQLLTEARADGVRVVLAPEVIVECLTQPGHSLLPWHRVLAQVAREFGATLAPTVETFRAHRLDDLMIDYIHPNAHGNQILAEAIATAVLAASSPEIHARAPVDSPRLTAQSPASL